MRLTLTITLDPQSIAHVKHNTILMFLKTPIISCYLQKFAGVQERPERRRIRAQEEIYPGGELIPERLFGCGRCGGVGHSRRT